MAVQIEQDSFRFLAFPSMNIAVKVMVDQKTIKSRHMFQKKNVLFNLLLQTSHFKKWQWKQPLGPRSMGKTQASRLGSIDGLRGALPLVLSFGAEKIFGTGTAGIHVFEILSTMSIQFQGSPVRCSIIPFWDLDSGCSSPIYRWWLHGL